MNSYLTSESSHPLAVHGASGSGKTSIMAKGIANAVSSVMYEFLPYFTISEYLIVLFFAKSNIFGAFLAYK